MKCDIILDLLPLYAEDLCRPQSKKAVTDHLAGCPSCQAKYQKLLEELLPDSSGSSVGDSAKAEETERYLEEKKLFQKSRDAVRASLFERIQRGTEVTVFVLALLCNLAAAALVIGGYGLRYPKLYFGELGMTQVWILIASLLPTFLSLAGVVASHKKNRNKLLRLAPKVVFWLLIPSILIGALGTALFLTLPPLCSGTDRISHYLVLDKDMEPYADSLAELFPEQIPAHAVARTYHYRKYSSLFSDSMTVECSFRLTEDEYEAVKAAALESRCFNSSKGEGTGPKPEAPFATTSPSGTVSTTIYPENLHVTFTYDDESHTVHYQAEIEQKH